MQYRDLAYIFIMLDIPGDNKVTAALFSLIMPLINRHLFYNLGHVIKLPSASP